MDKDLKPVVPQFVADWYEDNKGDLEFYIYDLCADYHNNKLEDKELREWFGDDSRTKPIQTFVNMHQFGYEVEKGKYYMAMLLLTSEYLRCDSEGELGHFRVDKNYILSGARAYWFTEDTLVKYKVWGNNSYYIEELKV